MSPPPPLTPVTSSSGVPVGAQRPRAGSRRRKAKASGRAASGGAHRVQATMTTTPRASRAASEEAAGEERPDERARLLGGVCEPESSCATTCSSERTVTPAKLVLIPEESGQQAGDSNPQVPEPHLNSEQQQQQPPMSLVERKWSQCSGASAGSSALGTTSRRSSASCMALDQGARSYGLRQAFNKLARNNSSTCSSRSTADLSSFRLLVQDEREQQQQQQQQEQTNNKQRQLSSERRTISRSMLELDPNFAGPGPGAPEFRVYWRELTFAYEPAWPARHLAKAAPGVFGGRRAGRAPPVLRGLSGSFRSNELIAVIGPSGCGKTTLLQFLAGNNSAQGHAMRIVGLARPKVAYIGQDDSLLPGLTARETLMFASRLQNARANFDHASHTASILAELGLAECADRNVSKLSGGQAKRVTIAQELLYPTNLLILDEVTSGLDASTSYAIVKLLKYLVSDRSYPMSIVMSIHQPSARLFSVFDRVYAMAQGQCLYEGPCEPAAINARLARFQLECPPYHNIADFLIELACSPSGCEEASAPPLGERVKRDPTKAQAGPPGPPMAAARAQMIAHQSSLSADALEQRQTDGRESHARAGDQAGRSLDFAEFEFAKLASFQTTEFSSQPERLMMPPEQATQQPSRAHQQIIISPADDTLDQSLYLAIGAARKQRPRPTREHFQIHFRRSLVRIRRSYILTYLQLVTYILLGLQLATFYGPSIGTLSGCPRLPANLMSYVLASGVSSGSNNSGPPASATSDSPDAADDPTLEMRRIQENMNFLLVTVMTATFAALEITVITFPLEAKTIKREWRNGWYRVPSYFLGRTLADLPFQLAFVLVFCALIYVLTGQLGLASWRFGSFVATIVMTALVAQSFGFIFGALFMDNLPAAVFTAPLAIFPALLFSGFFSRVSQIPAFYKPMTYLSHFRYAFDALLVTLYGFDRCACDQDALDRYHANLHNQTSSMRDMFGLLFGSADCIAGSGSGGESEAAASAHLQADARDISHEDLSAIRASNASLAAQMLQSMASIAGSGSGGGGHGDDFASAAPLQTGAPAGPAALSAGMRPLEDALLEAAFEQMRAPAGRPGELNDTSLALGLGQSPGDAWTSPSERLADAFSSRITSMLNKQANFGHEVPRACARLNSYLMTEFDLRDEDLLFGLAMLLLVLLVTRLLCGCILNFTIAKRAK